jgi:hypothetical protein
MTRPGAPGAFCSTSRATQGDVPVIREPVAEPFGLIETWIEDPDGLRIVLVEVRADHIPHRRRAGKFPEENPGGGVGSGRRCS